MAEEQMSLEGMESQILGEVRRIDQKVFDLAVANVSNQILVAQNNAMKQALEAQQEAANAQVSDDGDPFD